MILKLEDWQNIEDFDKKEYKIEYDYKKEKILWHKKDKALDNLKNGNTLIENLLEKITQPTKLAPNTLIENLEFNDKNLDENQKQAVIKALSLKRDSEILLIQGPPGTSKTTTIVEIIKQNLSKFKNSKILVSSQSNQAVDNVLEKIEKNNNKILHIGNDEDKISEISKKYLPQKVLNKLIIENLKRIKANPITHQNLEIENKLKELQQNFAKSLQSITSKMAQKDSKLESEIGDLFTKNIRVIFGTLIGISSWRDFKVTNFDVAIVDEACRATLSELLVPLIKSNKIILVGDHRQLASVINDEIGKNLEYINKAQAITSHFETIFNQMEQNINQNPYIENFKHTLTYNYRSEPKICELYNNIFYEGKLKQSKYVSNRAHKINDLK